MERATTRRGMLAAAAGMAVGAFFGSSRPSAASPPDGSAWQQGDANALIAGDPDGTMTIRATGDINLSAGHLRMGTVDGNYEFEHSAQVSQTTLNSYVIGTPNRTPVAVGGNDGQDVLAFSVRGMRGQKNDLQQWTLGEDVAVAVDGDGRLRLGEITLVAQVVNGKAELVGVLPNGHRQVLARA